jgi:hypothetical protein
MTEGNEKLENIVNVGTDSPAEKRSKQLCRMHQQPQFHGTLGMGPKRKDSSRKFALRGRSMMPSRILVVKPLVIQG